MIASGTDSDFIINKKNGYLVEDFNIDKITEIIKDIHSKPSLWNSLRDYSLKNTKLKINGNFQKKEYSYQLEKLNKSKNG